MLASPLPLPNPPRRRRFRYPVVAITYLPVPRRTAGPGIFKVMATRITRRCFAPVDRMQLAEFLWHVARTRRTEGPIIDSHSWEQRMAPSAGGMQAIDLIIQQKDGLDFLMFRYNSRAHALEQLRVKGSCAALWDAAQTILAAPDGFIIWFSADMEVMRARYRWGESLLWRDAGALLAYCCLVAEALGLASCPLGLTGEPMFADVFGAKRIRCFGGITIGARISEGCERS
jgi:SagB-type dehydrogenase family enzyme